MKRAANSRPLYYSLESKHMSQTVSDDFDISDRQFQLFRDLIYKSAGISLSDAKRQLVKSRLGKRLRHHGLKSFGDYYDLIMSNTAEVTALVNSITTNKTDFFREEHHFEFVANQIVPRFVAAASQGMPRRIRVWHAGCSSGEEPYTMAITLLEAMDGKGSWDIKLLATDIDTDVLAAAERGVYDADRASTIPNAMLRKYFLRRQDGENAFYKVKPVLRDLVKFKKINLTDDIWPIRSDVQFDIVFCRNVVIYFDKPTQQKLFAGFARVLKPEGHLFIGHSESLLGVSTAYESIGHTIYRLPDAGLARIAA